MGPDGTVVVQETFRVSGLEQDLGDEVLLFVLKYNNSSVGCSGCIVCEIIIDEKYFEVSSCKYR